MILISVIIPVYNIRNYIDECVQSVIAQTYKNWECILVDDGSTDGSEHICDKYSNAYSQISVVHKSNNGPSSARNAGIKEARGKYLYFIDGDDRIKPETLEHFVKLLKDSGDYDFIIGHMSKFSETMQPTPFPQLVRDEWVKSIDGKKAFVLIHEKNGLLLMGVRGVYSKDFILKNNLFFKQECRYSEDQEWTPRLFECAKRIRSNESFDYLYREGRPGSLMNSINLNKIEATLKVYDEWYNRVAGSSLEPFYVCLYRTLLQRYWRMYFIYPPQLSKENLSHFYAMMDKRKYFVKNASLGIAKGLKVWLIKYISSRYLCFLVRTWSMLNP